ncbi:class I SAM-dependent methyltransferase [Hymenobacter jejuensis]|uniref:Class I SAM-dependent methyltransferase n=1 Tax=Hymenobacter jejuensis TaxID=2502781 RepID=A0A5B7ZZY6_9BACT|nr:class I SAM-dependent methyltransferase [Hymenobacter jejuensis]QDA60721.1 class I SAM-dependent methyltransferase [Hymenobacter jejuensis]
MGFQSLDRFSGHADLYVQYRIEYPSELYAYIYSRLQSNISAWDCGTGNGQVATALAKHFAHVEATDISEAQLQRAIQLDNIKYSISSAEQTQFSSNSFDLITVAQALHWFDAAAFHQEVYRVAKPQAIIAEWGYSLLKVNQSIDPIVKHFYAETIGAYWDSNRKHIDDRFAKIPFPFAEVEHREFQIELEWDAERFLNYLRTWSSVQQYQQQNNSDALLLISDQVRRAWGEQKQVVEFPVFIRTGRVIKH